MCSDDEHSNLEPERHRPVCVFLHAVDGCCRGGRHSYVTSQHLRPVRVSYLADKTTNVDLPGYINLRHISYGVGTLRCCYPPRLVPQQCKTSVVGDREITQLTFYRAALNAGRSSQEKGVRLSVCQSMYCDKMEENCVLIFIPHQIYFSLVF